MSSNKNRPFFYKNHPRLSKNPVLVEEAPFLEEEASPERLMDPLPTASLLEEASSKAELDIFTRETKHALVEAEHQKAALEKELGQKQHSLLLGGFIKIRPSDETALEPATPVNTLKQALKETEQEIFQLTATLKMTEALEKAHHAEAARRFEENLRKLYEEKAKQALQYADQALLQMQQAVEQTEFADTAKKIAEKNQLLLETEYKQAQQKIQTLEQSRLNATTQRQKLEQQLGESENRESQVTIELKQQITELQKSLKISEVMYQQEKTQKQEMAKKLEQLAQQLTRLENVLEHERTLRKLLEECAVI